MQNNFQDLFAAQQEPERNLYLSGEVCEESVQDLISKIVEINEYDNKLADEYYTKKSDALQNVFVFGDNVSLEIPPLDREPIMLYIDSGGGEVYSGFGLVNAITNSETDVITIVMGKAMSMALLIAMAGKERYAYKTSTFMYHDISTGEWGKLEEFKRTVNELERLEKIYDDMIIDWSYIQKPLLEYKKERTADWYFGGIDARRMGVVDWLIDDDEYDAVCSGCGKYLDECDCDGDING